MRHVYFLLSVTIALAFLSGCSPEYEVVNLNGRVTVDEQPITEGSVTFVPEESGLGSGVRTFINSDGTYSAKKVPVGKVRVTIIASKKTGNKIKGFQGEDVDEFVSVIPPQYKSGVLMDITKGQKQLDFDWTSPSEPVQMPGTPPTR